MTSGTKRLFIGATALLFLAGTFLVFFNDSPKQKGKLFDLLNQIDDGTADRGIRWAQRDRPSAKQLQAAEEIRSLGTNAVPLLLEEIQASSPEGHIAILMKIGLNWIAKKLAGNSTTAFS